MKNLKLSIIAALLVSVMTGLTLAQPATTATTFRMYNSATSSVSITASAGAGTGTFTWPQPSAGIFKSTAGGVMSIGAIGLNTGDVTGTLNVSNGGTGNTVVGAANSVAFSDGTKITYTAAPTAAVNSILVSIGGAAPTYSTTLPSSIGVPFTNITSGTNTAAAMVVGAGASLAPSGGTITANQFVGTGSTSNAVDLGTGEVSGTLGVANGGTGNTVIGGAGTVAYSDGAKITYSAAGTAGQVLQSNGAGAPTWLTLASQAIAKGRVAGDGVNFSYTITPGVTLPAGSTIIATLESATNATVTVTSRTGTTAFTVQAPFVLSATDFINYIVF